MQQLIRAPPDLPAWRRSKGYDSVVSFLRALGAALSHPLGFPTSSSSSASLAVFLVELEDSVLNFRITSAGVRFAHPEFRDWLALGHLRIEHFLRSLQVAEDAKAALSFYLGSSLGSAQRLDYGTGHELNFLVAMLALFNLGIYSESELECVASQVFPGYFSLIRTLILHFNLEPAGSHGVWGLDDYQFLPFLLGAHQQTSQTATPAETLSKVQRNEQGNSIFEKALLFVEAYKKGNFAEHSPILFDICTTLDWGRISSGLAKMYQAEVLDKFPIVQHLRFSSIFPF